MYKIIKGRLKYGVFKVVAKCKKCEKVLIALNFCWGTDEVDWADDDKIKEACNKEFGVKEINYCSKCGSKIN